MIGQLIISSCGRGRMSAGQLYGLPVLRAEVNPSGFWGPRRLTRAGRGLRRSGVLRVLAPGGWLSALERFGLRPVDPEPFVRAQSVPLVLAALERQGLPPSRTIVALRGGRADRDMVRTAEELCAHVRSLVIDAPRGGAELARHLRRKYGMPILPKGEQGQAALAFQPGTPCPEEVVLELFSPTPRLAGLLLTAPGLEEGDRDRLPLLTALWEGGKLGAKDIKIT